MKCNYSNNFTNETTGEEVKFVCNNEAVQDNDSCKFHLNGYLNEQTRDSVIKEFEKMLNAAKSKTEKIQFIGYILPAVSLLNSGKDITIPIDFSFVKFKEKIDFSNICFKCKISFYHTVFEKSANFTHSKFEKDVSFSYSKFLLTSNFLQYVTFNQVDFTRATLTNVKFKKSTFNKALFINTKFHDSTSFWKSKFTHSAKFNDSIFFDSVDFSESEFNTLTRFDGVTFKIKANFSRVVFNDEVNFNGNLSTVSFLDTNIKGVTFGNKTTWDQIDSKNIPKDGKLATKNTDYKIYDERILEENNETLLNLESVKSVYRDLRDNFERQLKYDTAGEFFVREMELNRKYQNKRYGNGLITTKKFPLKRVFFSFYWWYNIIAQYGQSCYRPIFFATAIITIGTCFFLNENIEDTTIDSQILHYDTVQTALVRSLSAFIPLVSFNQTTSHVDFVMRLLLLPVSLAFFVSLKRKMERKLRH